MAAASGLLPSTSVSSRYSGMRPTSARHTLTRTCSPARSTVDLHVGGVQRQAVRVERWVALLLPAVGVEALAEVALGVEQADADERQAEVGGGLQVVAGEDAEAAGVLRQRLGDAELGGEVGDEAAAASRRGSGTSAAPRPRRAGARRRRRWRRRRPRRRPARPSGRAVMLAEQAQRVAAGGLPQRRVEPLEQRLGARGPRSSAG